MTTCTHMYIYIYAYMYIHVCMYMNHNDKVFGRVYVAHTYVYSVRSRWHLHEGSIASVVARLSSDIFSPWYGF